MKSLVFFLAMFSVLLMNAQTKEGRVVYERTIQMPVRMFANNPELARQLPKSRTDNFELFFTSTHALWQYLPSANNEDAGTFTGPGVVMHFAGGANEVSYQDFEKGLRIDQREVMERSFIVTDSIKKLNWKLSDETKSILNFAAHKAVTKRISTRPRVTVENGEVKREEVSDTANIVAWYTTDIPVPAGPDFQGQLPGLILELDVNNGQSITKAVEVSAKPVAAKIKEPRSGKKVTAAEFQAEREKLMAEMRKNMPAGNVFRMN